MVFHWSLSDSKSLQVSRTLLSIRAVLNNVVVWIISTRLPTSKSSSPFSNPLVTVPNVPITIGISVTFMFLSFYNSKARSRYISFFSHFFSFILWSAATAKSTILQVLFFFLRLLLGLHRLIDPVCRVFVNGLGDLGSIPGHVIPKTFKMILHTLLLNTQQYKLRIEGKVGQSRERCSALPYTLVL